MSSRIVPVIICHHVPTFAERHPVLGGVAIVLEAVLGFALFWGLLLFGPTVLEILFS